MKVVSQLENYLSESKNHMSDYGMHHIYNADYNNLLEIIKNIDNSINTLMITGHNPSLFDLTKYISKKSIHIFPTCTMVSISFKTKNWLFLEKANLNFIIYPDLFK